MNRGDDWIDLAEKSALVTGASRGIGRCIAQAFAERGAGVAIHYRENEPAADTTLSSLPGGPHRKFRADLADPSQVRALARDVIDWSGRLDVLVNNAGIFEEHRLTATDYAQWQRAWNRTLQTNLQGPANLMYCVAEHMKEHGGGRIVNVSSRGAFRGEPDAPAYGASKAGLNALSQSLAKALGGHGIFIFTVAPGFVETEMARGALTGPRAEFLKGESPLGRVARPEEVARAVVFLAAEGSEFLTGCIVDINGASYLRT